LRRSFHERHIRETPERKGEVGRSVRAGNNPSKEIVKSFDRLSEGPIPPWSNLEKLGTTAGSRPGHPSGGRKTHR